MKRIFDITLSTLVLCFGAPVLLIIAIAVRYNLGSPVIFKQFRPGKNGKPFLIYKFRSLSNQTDARGKLLPDEKRLTRFGRTLRNSSLDELPELLNVLKGDMSIVGPRPLLMQYLNRYNTEQSRRHDVKPGITGWAQVNGRNAVSWSEKFKMDVWYVENQSLWLDLKIILMTISKVLRREGISQQGQATAEEFMGNE